MSETDVSPILLLMFVCSAVWFWILVPREMAKNRDRHWLVRVPVYLMLSPLLAILLLWALGKAQNGAEPSISGRTAP